MIEFAKENEENKKQLTAIVSKATKMNNAIVEKDFYVVLMLYVLFQHSKYGKHFAFKGGTSLSKAYDIIKRFSEDIDLILDWRILGLTNEEIWQDRSNTKQDLFIKKINELAGNWIKNELIPELEATTTKLKIPNLTFSIKDDNQTVIINYPKIFKNDSILPEIRLEIGPLGAWTPNKNIKISSYIAETIPQAFKIPSTTIPVVEAKRTFWEKATILHKEANRIVNKTPTRYSRHYYDLALLAKTNVKNEALSDPELLKQVVTFKQKFYRSNAARYEEATIKNIKLLPKPEQIDDLRKDYQKMRPMFYQNPPAFDEILQILQNLENEIHQL